MWHPLFFGCIRPEELLIHTHLSAAGQHYQEIVQSERELFVLHPSSDLFSSHSLHSLLGSIPLISFPPLSISPHPAPPHNSFLCISSLSLYANPLSPGFSEVSAMRLSGVRTMQGRTAETLLAACCKTSYHHAAIMMQQDVDAFCW